MDTVRTVLLVIVVALMLLLAKQGKDHTTQLDTIGAELQQVNAQLDLVRQSLPGTGRPSAP